MRISLVFLLSGAVGFGVMWNVAQPPGPPAQWTPPPLRPPPLDLSMYNCVQTTSEDTPDEWSVETAEAYLLRIVSEYESVDLLGLDCDEAPCIAWVQLNDEQRHPGLTYRWWSLEDMPQATMWTASHSFQDDKRLVQAVVAAPARPSSAELSRVQQRLDAGLQRYARSGTL
ncbi:MAG: hypothetical protein AAFV53_27560 [Myxococcota bacterium]